MTTAQGSATTAHVLFAALSFSLLSILSSAAAQPDVWISEFVADNDGTLVTQAGDAADWIELHNSGTDAVDLSGWYLADKDSTPAKWRIPDGTSIASNGYLVIFADSSSTSLTNGELHANFSLSKDGEYLGLVLPDGVTVADAYAPLFPPQYLGS